MGSIEIEDNKILSPNLPIIDFSRWTSPSASSSDRQDLAKELVNACHSTGFVYMINHGISPELLEEVFTITRKFYDLQEDQKMQAGHPEGSRFFRGYSWPGHEKALNSYPGSEYVDAGKNDFEDAIDLTESYGIGSDSKDGEPNVWLPESTLPGFRKLTTKFYWECWKTSQDVLRALALGLGFEDEDYLLRFHSGHENELSLRHYPAVAESVIANQRMKRLSPHTDFDSFTLLFQDDCGGLEVQKSGQPGDFVHAEPIKNALVMNIGDVLMRWSNDYLTSTIHRVHLPPLQDRYTGEERMTRERFSIPYFINPKGDTVMECLPVCHSKDNPPKYEPMAYRDYVKERVSHVFPE